jgi:phage tail-like protein
MELYKWHREGLEGHVQRKSVAIIVLDEAGFDKARWELREAWPSKYEGADLNAKGSEVAIETLEITCESIERVS